jgi:PAS domain S-box-containing protein
MVLCISMTATLYIWKNVDREISERGKTRFISKVEEICQRIIDRLEGNETILRGGTALFNVYGDTLSRGQWQTYASSLHLETTNPGILGFGFSAWLTADHSSSLIDVVRAEGFANFSINPQGERPQYSAIIWLEPFNTMNQRAFGYDMYAEPVRRAAMDYARDTGKTSISGKVVLVQERGEVQQNGVLMYIPSYRASLPIDTVQQRRQALRGFVYSPIRMNDFILGALKKTPDDVDFTLYSGTAVTPENELCNSAHLGQQRSSADRSPRYTATKSLELYGTTWQIAFRSLPAFDQEFNPDQARALLFAGTMISVGLGLLAYLQGQARFQALIIADQMRERLVTQQKFAHHIQQSPLAVIEWDMQGMITAWNPAAQTIFGYSAKEAAGRQISMLLVEKDPRGLDRFQTAGACGMSTHLNLTRDNRILDCQWYVTTLQDETGAPLGRVALVQDVSERNRTEEALRQERNLLQSVMDGAKKFHLVYLDRDFNFVRVNQTYAQSCGYTPEEMIGKNHFALYPNAENLAIFTRVRETGEPFEVQDKPFEFPDQPKRGVTWWSWTLSAVKEHSGTVKGLVFSLHETTQRKQLEIALKASEAQFRLMFEGHSAIMLLIDPLTGDILKANRAAAEFYGYSQEQLQAMTIFRLNCLPPEKLLKILHQVNAGELNEFALPHRLVDGTVRTVEVHTAAISLQDKSVNFAVIHDITDRIEAEEQRQRLEAENIQLQKSESLGRMAGAIAHHFNNKLQAVMMSLEMVVDIVAGAGAVSTNHQIGKLAHSALESANAAADISKQLLTYLGSAPCSFSLLDPAEVCRGYQPVLLASLPEGIELDVQTMPLGLTIHSNAGNLRQILTNLLTNAWEACFNGRGRISLSLFAASGAEIQEEHRFPPDFRPGEGQYACLEVGDNGCGIKEQDFDRLFDPFFSRKFTGRGMGLPAVLGIVRAHRGAITVNSREGQGSTFRVYFPMFHSDREEVDSKTQVISRKPAGGTLLVVEDEVITRRLISAMLMRLGYAVLEAEDGIKALEVFDRHRETITCVLCDIVMPRMNGWETIAAIRQRDPKMPVILCSGFNEAQAMEGEQREKPQAFLEKPFLFTRLKEVLAVIEQQR